MLSQYSLKDGWKVPYLLRSESHGEYRLYSAAVDDLLSLGIINIERNSRCERFYQSVGKRHS